MPDFKAKFKCPGCGSPLEMLEGTISLRCKFCGLVMRIGAPDRILKYCYPSPLDDFALKFSLERHFKENGAIQDFRGSGHKLFYLPFYRFRGMAYSLLSEKSVECDVEEGQATPVPKTTFQQKCRHLDLTIPAFDDMSIGLDSLGIRPAVIPLDLFDIDAVPSESVPLDITQTPDEARKTSLGLFAFNLGFALEGKECAISEIVGDKLSVIYYPVWAHYIQMNGMQKTAFIDGLSKRVINIIDGGYEYSPKNLDSSKSSSFSPVQHRCPNCGSDFPVSDSALVYRCSNCERFYAIKGDEYRQIQASWYVFEPAANLYPFWRMPLEIGDNLRTVSQFSRILTGEIPLIARNKAAEQFYLYVPAFMIPNLESLTTVALRLCRTQPILSPTNADLGFGADVALEENDASELARFYWYLIRCRYRHLLEGEFELRPETLGRPELIWLTASIPGARKLSTADSSMANA